jgi:2'-5' RNA ligase
MSETTRTFLAVFPPVTVVERVADALESVRQAGDGVGWVKSANVHYTLRFLGDLEPAGVEAAKRAAAHAALATSPFRIALGSPGIFPDARRPRVLWLGASAGAQALTGLARALETALVSEGFGRADKPFAPHLTLGRVRDTADGPKVATRFLAARFPSDAFEVRELLVVRSTLDPRGALYEPLAAVAFGSVPDAP